MIQINVAYLYALIPVGTISAIYLIRKLRELQWGWVTNNSSLQGKIYVVTGANTGLGFETAKALVARGATVVMACRNVELANEAIAKIRLETAAGTMSVIQVDLASFDSIKEFSKTLQVKYPVFDCLIENAGLAVKTSQLTQENIEVHFAVNHLGHFLLTQLLSDQIKKNRSRVVVVSSLMHQKGKIDFDNLGKLIEQTQSSRSNTYYNDSKLANFYFAQELYRKGYDCHVLCPGLCHTDFFRDYNPKWYHYILFAPVVWLMLRSAKQGAQNIIHCATDNVNSDDKNPATGYMIRNLKQTKSKVNFNKTVAEKLWNESLKMCERALQ